MNYGVIAVGVALALVGVLLRTRMPAPVVGAMIGIGAAVVATGGLLLIGGASPINWVVALGLAAGSAVLHARLVLGPFGTPA